MRTEETDVVVTGAGPSGSVAAALLRQKGHRVMVLEREAFPRFSIGESLLPQSMVYLEEAGLLRDVMEAGFQHKNGASFCWRGALTDFDFRDRWGEGWSTTYQVERARFDDVLARGAARAGADVRFRHEVTALELPSRPGQTARVSVRDEQGLGYDVRARLVLDASGFGRLLPRLLGLDRPSRFPVRQAIFTHIEDGIGHTESFDRNKIRVTVHPAHVDVWFWLIPFANGRSSIGVVAEASRLDAYEGDFTQQLRALVSEDPTLASLLARARWDTPARTLRGYASDVSALSGPGFALLGNAGEFLDPIFSSGVTIALTSASLAARAADRELKGHDVSWEADFARPLRRGVDAFRAFVEAWYAGVFQRIIFHPVQPPDIRRKICAILAGYAWDDTNPFATQASRKLAVLSHVCA